MPTILQINVTSNWGSTGRIAEAIGKSAIKSGWNSYVAYGRYNNPSESLTFKIGNNISTYLHFAADRLFDKEGRASVIATKRLVTQIESIRPDVVHLHNIHDHYINYPILFEYLNSKKIEVVWTFHDCWAFTGHCKHFVESRCDRWLVECRDCPIKDSFIDNSTDNYQLKRLLFTANSHLTIVPASDWLARFVRKSFLKDKPIRVIHNGVDLQKFSPLLSKSSDGLYYVLAVSNKWPEYKGLGDIIKLRHLLQSDYIITVVGLSEKQIQNLPYGIKGLQRTQNIQELVSLYRSADVLINPTYADTFPTVNLEALACGTPVVTYNTGGSPEAVDEKTGIVIEQGNVESMANAVMKLRAHPLSREDCRNRAEIMFDKDVCFNEYIKLYEELISK